MMSIVWLLYALFLALVFLHLYCSKSTFVDVVLKSYSEIESICEKQGFEFTAEISEGHKYSSSVVHKTSIRIGYIVRDGLFTVHIRDTYVIFNRYSERFALKLLSLISVS